MNSDKLDLRPGGLEVLSTGLNLVELDLHGGEGFWDEVARGSREDIGKQLSELGYVSVEPSRNLKEWYPNDCRCKHCERFR